MKYIKKTMLLAIILILLKVSSVYAVSGTVLQDGIRIRKGPSTDTAIVTVLNKEAPVEIIEETNGWYKVKYTQLGNYEGYMRKDFIKQTGTGTIPVTDSVQTTPTPVQTSNPTPTPTATPTPVNTSTPTTTETPKNETTVTNLLGKKIVSNDANVYILPVVTSSVKDTIKKDSEISVREIAGNFAYVEYNGKTGWVRTSLIQEKSEQDTTKKTTNRGSSSRESAVNVTAQVVNTPTVKSEVVTKPVSASSIGEQIASMSKTYVGYKYVYGGASPSTGFDCSGLVYYICGKLGCKVNRTADAQANNGVYVEKENLQPGDLVFFTDYKTNKGIGHVGIYIGNNQFVHASTPTAGVIVSSLSEASYVKRYVTARRVDV